MKPLKVTGIATLVLLICLSLNARAAAQTTTAAEVPPAPAPKPKVVGLTEGHLELDVLVRVEVDHLAEWAMTPGNNPAKLVPFLNGLALKGIYPQEIHTTQNHLRFHLQITPENKEAWIDLLGEPEGIRKPVLFSVGLEGQSPFDTEFHQDNMLPLTVISPWYGVVAFAIVLVTLILLIWLAQRTNIIREPGPKPPGGKLRPYNLGRTQMAFWFFLVYSSYLVIWLITSALDTITASLLGLMGISAGTALSEAIIDSGKDVAAAGQMQDLDATKRSLEQSIPDLQSQLTALNTKDTMEPEDLSNRDSLNRQLLDYRSRLAQANDQIDALTQSASSNVSGGFLRDILSDKSGYSFHRFQIFAWTIVLGVIFISSVYNSLTMPEFSTTLLGLMGISSGTYIGFKFPEQK